MGVFKWLRRERMTVTTRHSVSPAPATPEEQYANSTAQIGTIRTEEYKRDLAEFQARRSLGNKDKETPKKKCGRHSLPVSCTDCSADHDNTFNYEKKSAVKYKKKQSNRACSITPEKVYEGVPNIQFLFQNQVFMPGNLYPTSSFSEPHKSKRHSRHVCRSPDMEFVVQKHIDFREDEQIDPPPDFCKNSSLPYEDEDVEASRRFADDVDGMKTAGDVKASSQSSESANKDDSCEEKLWEVMSELKHFDQWADEQLQLRSPNMSKSDDSKSETSAYGLPIASSCNLDVMVDKNKVWNNGKWGVVPVQIKKLTNVTTEHVRKKRNTEINILRKCRHPNIILMMGLYPDAQNNVHIICERCVDSLFGIIHVQGRILTAQTAVQYALDIANALMFLRMQGYVHSELSSMSVMVTAHDTAKLADLGPCARVHRPDRDQDSRPRDAYTVEPQYVNIEDACEGGSTDREPLLSARSSAAYMATRAARKHYTRYENSELCRWQAPELFTPDERGLVYPCSRSDVYSLCLMLWECCNASIPWKNLNYEKLKHQYTVWKAGVSLPQDGTYPGCLLSLLQDGLTLDRFQRIDLDVLQRNLHKVKQDLDDIGYVIIPARLPKKKSTFSTSAWEIVSPTDSECQSPQNIEHKAVIHKSRDSSTDSSEKEYSKSDSSPLYETIRKSYKETTYAIPEKCFISDEDNVEERPVLKYDLLPEKECSSACSTPITKIKARLKDSGTPGTLHRSDSTEYCSILSPNRTVNFSLHDNSNKDQSSVERPTAKLSRSFTPKSYKPLHIKVPEYNLDSIRPLLREKNSEERSSYNFDIQNYSLPTTPIARSNKLRKNAWLSGDLSASDRFSDKNNENSFKSDNKLESIKDINSAPETPATSIYAVLQKKTVSENNSLTPEKVDDTSAESVDTIRNSYTGLRKIDPPVDLLSSETDDTPRERTNSWWSQPPRATHKYKVEDDVLANLHVKPLVAIHEKWIYEANKKTGRSMSLPEDNRANAPAVKPASHCVDTLQKSLPQLNLKKQATKPFWVPPSSPNSCLRNGVQWDQYSQVRESLAKNIRPSQSDVERLQRRDSKDGTAEEKSQTKIDQATDTRSIEEFIRDLIRKEFQHLLHEISDDTSTASTLHKNEDILNKGVANIIESLNTPEEEKTLRKEPTKSFSRVKINGNNKPLLQITFSRSGENSLQVLDNCVNVTICDNNSGKDKINVSLEETLTEDVHVNSLKRCQAFNAIQEARSTEDLYIDDDLSTQMQENFGGKVKLIPLHGSLHEILCEKEDDCCLVKVKQENGCDTIYFRCDNSDTESRDAIDGTRINNSLDPRDTVVFKRSISLVEERIQRIFPKEKRVIATRNRPEKERPRPKSEVFIPIKKESRLMSISSPSLAMNDKEEVEVNIENVMCYQDSSSEECLKCQENDDFELLERKIEEDMANNLASMTCGCLEKISEENLSVLNEDIADKD